MPKVLAVDDSPDILDLIKDTLTEYEVITANNGKEAVEMTCREMPDLILMDIAMPVMNGIEATGVIKKDPATRSIPVLIVTAYGGKEPMIAALNAGADDFIEKPFDADVLKARVSAYLRVKALLDSIEQNRKDHEIMLDITREATSTLNITRVLFSITRKTAEYLNLSRCSMILVDEKKGHGLVIASSDDPDIGGRCIFLDKYPEITRVMKTMEPLVIDDAHTDPLMSKAALPRPYKSIMVIPIIFRDEVIGTLLLRASMERGVFTRREADISRMIANSSANPIKNAFLYEGLEGKKLELEKANKRLLELDNLKSSFLAMAAHELRSPLSVINGYLELMMEGIGGPFSPKATAYLTMATEAGRGLTRTVEEILDISVIESGKLPLNLKQRDIVKKVKKVLDFMSKAMEEKGLKVHTSFSNNEVKAVFDGGKLEQVLINLLSNAVKFTPPSGNITVDVKKQPDEVIVTVSDTGCGIPADALGMVFDEFYKGQSREKGAGLGLSICKRIVEVHGGRMWAESREGEGSSFHFTLPNKGPETQTTPHLNPLPLRGEEV